MSPHTVTGVLTGCTFDSSSNRSQTISHSCFSSFSGRYLQSRAISTHLSRSVDIVCVCVCVCCNVRVDDGAEYALHGLWWTQQLANAKCGKGARGVSIVRSF